MSQLHAAKKKRYADKDAELLKQVSNKTITRETLSEKLAQHVEQVIPNYFLDFVFYGHLGFLSITKSQIFWLHNILYSMISQEC